MFGLLYIYLIYRCTPSNLRYPVSAKCIIKSANDQDMSTVRSMSGVGILATLILMFSIVMFVGTLFWLMTDAGFLLGAPGSSLFKPATIPDDNPRTLNQTIKTLQQSGCMVVYYTKEYAGGYDDWLVQRKEPSPPAEAAAGGESKTAPQRPAAPSPTPDRPRQTPR